MKLATAFPALFLVVTACVGVIPDAAGPEVADQAAIIPTTAAVTTTAVATTLPAVVETTTSVVIDTSVAASPTTTQAVPPESVASAESLDDFTPRVFTIDETLAETVASSWRADCPVPLEALRLVQVRFWDFSGIPTLGWLVVHADVADAVGRVFEELFEARYPIQQIKLVDVYDNDDDRSMEANNTSAFNCRTVSGSSSWSEHAYGRAIDINPMMNPFVTGSGAVYPPSGAQFVDRTLDAEGLITADGAVVQAFASIGWEWGGNWNGSKDYQHFSESGR